MGGGYLIAVFINILSMLYLEFKPVKFSITLVLDVCFSKFYFTFNIFSGQSALSYMLVHYDIVELLDGTTVML